MVLEKDGHAFIYDPADNKRNDSLVVNYYNDHEYQIVLGQNGELYSYKEQIKYDKSVINYDIAEIDSDISSDDPVVMIRYNNGHVLAFNYHNGDVLYDDGRSPKISLFEFFRVSTKSNNVSNQNDSFRRSNDLKETLDGLKDEDILSILNGSSKSSKPANGGEDPSEKPSHIIDNLDEQAGSVVDKNLSSKYVTSYNSRTGRYDVYNIEDILDTKQNDIITLENKIDSNESLSNYFHDSRNVYEIIKDNRFLVFGIIILVILINLGLLVVKTRKVE